jgi:hypothetical protein
MLRINVSCNTSKEELPVGKFFVVLVTYLLVIPPGHKLHTGKQAHNLLQHVCAGNMRTHWCLFVHFFSGHAPYWERSQSVVGCPSGLALQVFGRLAHQLVFAHL